MSIIDELAQYRYVALDIETTGLSWQKDKMFGYSVAYGDKTKWFNIDDLDAVPVLNYLLSSSKHRVIGHNISFDLSFIREQIKIEAQYPFHCTMTMAFLINENRSVGLKSLAKEHNLCALDIYDNVKKQKRGVKNDFSLIDRELMSKYCQIDSSNTLKLFNIYKDEIQAKYRRIYALEMNVIPVLMDMENTGVLIDRSYLESIAPKLKLELEEISKEIIDSIGYDININSDKQLCEYFYDKLKLPVSRTTTKDNPSVDSKALRLFNNTIADKILKYRDLDKDYTTYVIGILNLLDNNNVLHTSFNTTDRVKSNKKKIGAVTGRLSSSDPDLQNIPRVKKNKDGTEKTNIRKSFISRKEMYNYYLDYSGMELVGAAHFSRCISMLNALITGDDLHAITASKIYNIPVKKVSKHPERDVGKKTNFAVTYGIGNLALAENINAEVENANFTWEDGKRFKAAYFSLYPEIKEYYNITRRQLIKSGYVETICGRRGRIELEKAYKAPNFIIQGSCADIIKLAMVEIYKKYGKNKLILQVHDELQIQGIDDKQAIDIANIMSNVVKLRAPLRVEISKTNTNWNNKETVNI